MNWCGVRGLEASTRRTETIPPRGWKRLVWRWGPVGCGGRHLWQKEALGGARLLREICIPRDLQLLNLPIKTRGKIGKSKRKQRKAEYFGFKTLSVRLPRTRKEPWVQDVFRQVSEGPGRKKGSRSFSKSFGPYLLTQHICIIISFAGGCSAE